MATNAGVMQYIGARYVPKFFVNSDNNNEWRSGVEYEPLMVVTWNSNSYTSRRYVPTNIGNPSENPEYWVATGMYNSQINELAGRVNSLETGLSDIQEEVDGIVSQNSGEPVNVLTLGVDNTGVQDCSAILNAATAEHTLYFPDGTYRLAAPFNIQNSIFGSNGSRPGFTQSTVTGTVFLADFESDMETAVLVITSNQRGANTGMEIEHISINCNNKANISGLQYAPLTQIYGRITMKMEDIHVGNVGEAAHGFYLTAPGFLSRAIWLNNFSVYAQSEKARSLLYIGEGLADCSFSNFELMYGSQGVECHGGTCRFFNAHMYCGRASADISDLKSYYSVCIGMNMFATAMCDNIYTDSYKQAYVQRNGVGFIGNMQVWYDTFANTLPNSDGIAIRTGSLSARVVVSNLLVGGPKTVRKLVALILGDRASTEQMTVTEWNDIDETKPGLLPWITESSLRKSYILTAADYAANNRYLLFAVAYMGSDGYVAFSAGRRNMNSLITVSKNGSTITVTSAAHVTQSRMDAYYRISGNFVYFYGIQYGDDFNVQAISLSGTGRDVRTQNSLLSIPSIPEFTPDSQATTDGLTHIE